MRLREPFPQEVGALPVVWRTQKSANTHMSKASAALTKDVWRTQKSANTNMSKASAALTKDELTRLLYMLRINALPSVSPRALPPSSTSAPAFLDTAPLLDLPSAFPSTSYTSLAPARSS